MSTVRSVDFEGGVRALTLDRSPANAIDETLLADLGAALDAAAADDAVRAVVLTGAGAFFSGGFDFATPRREDQVAFDLYAQYRDTHRKLLVLPKPTIAMMNGHAIAGGLVLVLACDVRLGVEGAYRIGLTEVAVGASFPRAAFEIVRLRLSHAAASELILEAGLHTASEAVRLGVVHTLCPADAFEQTLLERARGLAAFPREAYAHSKAALVAEAVARIDAETAEEALQTMSVWLTPESRGARRQQREKLGVRS